MMDVLAPIGDLDPADLPSDEEYTARIYAAAEEKAAEWQAVEEARTLRDDLLALLEIPVEERPLEQVVALTTQGSSLAVRTVGMRDPELIALSTECGNLALAATQQRLAYLMAQGVLNGQGAD